MRNLVYDRQRVIYYVREFDKLGPLTICAIEGFITHALISFFHLGYDDEKNKKNPYIHLNNLVPDDPSYNELWKTVAAVQGEGVKVLGSLGGASVGDFRNMFADEVTYGRFYKRLKDTLIKYSLDGLDLDIEEPVVTTANIQKLITDLRKDMKAGFLIVAAPVASALMNPPFQPDGWLVDYKTLIGSVDFYILQFYNGFGAPRVADYDKVIAYVGADNTKKIVCGTLTSPEDADPYGLGYVPLEELKEQIKEIAYKYFSDFGGVSGWTYEHAKRTEGARVDPITWAKEVFQNNWQPTYNRTSGSTGLRTSRPVSALYSTNLSRYYIYVRDAGGNAIFQADSADGKTWTSIRRVEEFTSEYGLCAVEFNKEIHLFFRGRSSADHLLHVYTKDGQRYEGALPGWRTGLDVKGPVSVAPLGNDKLVIVGVDYRGKGILYSVATRTLNSYWNYDNGYTGIETQPDTPCCVVNFRGQLHLFYRDSGQEPIIGQRTGIMHATSGDGKTWNTVGHIPDLTSSFGTSAIVVRDQIQLFFFGRDSGDGLLQVTSFDGVNFLGTPPGWRTGVSYTGPVSLLLPKNPAQNQIMAYGHNLGASDVGWLDCRMFR